MADVTAITKQFNDLPPHVKGLFQLGKNNTPFMKMAGLTNGAKTCTSTKFEMSQVLDQYAGSTTGLSEDSAIAGVSATTTQRAVEYNVVQLFEEMADISKLRQSVTTGLTQYTSSEGDSIDPETLQIAQKLEKMYANITKSALYGTYNEATTSAEIWQMGGIIPQVEANGWSVDALAGALDKTLMNTLFATMFDGGADYSDNMTIFCSATKKQLISSLYGVQPRDFMIGGINVTRIHTDFGEINVVADRMIANTDLLVANMNLVSPVFLPVDGEMILVEEKNSAGASDRTMVYSQASVDFATAKAHGVIRNLA